MKYTGLPAKLRTEVFERDNHRCRWCGTTNGSYDIHHIEYRRGISYDRLDNLVTLCRTHHSFVHGLKVGGRDTITKDMAQKVLFYVISTPGSTGASYWRRLKARPETEQA